MTRSPRRAAPFGAGLLLLGLVGTASAQSPEAPAADTVAVVDTLKDLVVRARAHQEETDKVLRKYSWIQHESSELSKPNGDIAQRSQRKVRVFPDKGGTFVELLEVDGRPPTKKELAANEKQNARMEERAEKKSDDPDDDANGALLELLSRTRCEIVGRHEENGRELIGIAFEPDPKAEGEGVEKKLLRHSRGTVWLDAETAQPVRGEAGAADKFRMKGVVGIKDFSLIAEQVRVGEEVWLPSRFHFEGDFSFLGIKRSIKTEVTFSDYSRASVSTEAEVEGRPATPPAP